MCLSIVLNVKFSDPFDKCQQLCCYNREIFLIDIFPLNYLYQWLLIMNRSSDLGDYSCHGRNKFLILIFFIIINDIAFSSKRVW